MASDRCCRCTEAGRNVLRRLHRTRRARCRRTGHHAVRRRRAAGHVGRHRLHRRRGGDPEVHDRSFLGPKRMECPTAEPSALGVRPGCSGASRADRLEGASQAAFGAVRRARRHGCTVRALIPTIHPTRPQGRRSSRRRCRSGGVLPTGFDPAHPHPEGGQARRLHRPRRTPAARRCTSPALPATARVRSSHEPLHTRAATSAHAESRTFVWVAAAPSCDISELKLAVGHRGRRVCPKRHGSLEAA
jgi:hypothetical protein